MSKLGERERDRAAAAVISDLRCLVGQWSPAAGDHAAELWAHELDGALSTLRHAIDDEWEDAVACRGSDESCDAAWPCTGIKRSDSRWAADRWCRIVLGVLRNRPEEFEDPYDAVLGVGLWIVGNGAEPTEQDWARWLEANSSAVTSIATMMSSSGGVPAGTSKDTWSQAELMGVMECGVDTVRRIRSEARISSGHSGKTRIFDRDEVQQMIECCLAHRAWRGYAKLLKLLIDK